MLTTTMSMMYHYMIHYYIDGDDDDDDDDDEVVHERLSDFKRDISASFLRQWKLVRYSTGPE